MKKKNLFLAVLAVGVLASCSNDEFVGNTAGIQTNPTGTISFGGGTAAMTRADFTGSAAADKLGNAMKVYGVKQDRATTTKYDDVFVNYSVKYDENKLGNDEYNVGWYYVGAETGQDIKYWDWASADYHFVAGSPVANFTYAPNANGDIATATVTGLGGRLHHDVSVASNTAAVYIADPKVVAKAAYNSEVEFTFRSMQTKVRVGIYETIPGYKVSKIEFYNNDDTPAKSDYITLNSTTDNYFQGGATTAVGGTVTYSWGTTPSYTFVYSGTTNSKYWEGAAFGTAGAPANTSAATNLYGTDSDMASDGYFIVMPTASATVAAPLTLTCDYTLTSLDGSGETIEVKGATATIPATYTKWEKNTAYTYLFKISKNTNGKTDPSQPNEGLYPIVFDAVVVNVADAGQNVGTETTVSTPSITVYQAGDVVTNGITYNTAAVTVKVMNGTTDATSSATIQYVMLDAFTYGCDYEKLGTNGAATSWVDGAPSGTLTTGKYYVIKATVSGNTAYFVLRVGDAEEGPANS